MLETSQSINRFKFNVPLEILKSDDKGWKVRGLASTEDRDLQGEIVRQGGLDISALKEGRGLLNYEHRNDPENLVGCIEDAQIGKDGLMIDGYLFRKHKRAQAIAEIMQSLPKEHSKRVQLSIEGKIKERDASNSKEIKQALVDRVAITFEPVNQSTYLQFAKSLTAENIAGSVNEAISNTDPKELTVTNELSQEIEKTMTAGCGGADAPAARSGGGALQPESVDGQEKMINWSEDTKALKRKKKKLLRLSMLFAARKYPEKPLQELGRMLHKAIEDKYPSGGNNV